MEDETKEKVAEAAVWTVILAPVAFFGYHGIKSVLAERKKQKAKAAWEADALRCFVKSRARTLEMLKDKEEFDLNHFIAKCNEETKFLNIIVDNQPK